MNFKNKINLYIYILQNVLSLYNFFYFKSKKHERHPKGVWFHSEIDHI